MKVVVDTNVLISGAFYAGPSSRILDACAQGKCRLVLSRTIVDEYARVGEEFTKKHPMADFARLLEILVSTAVFVERLTFQNPYVKTPMTTSSLHALSPPGRRLSQVATSTFLPFPATLASRLCALRSFALYIYTNIYIITT